MAGRETLGSRWLVSLLIAVAVVLGGFAPGVFDRLVQGQTPPPPAPTPVPAPAKPKSARPPRVKGRVTKNAAEPKPAPNAADPIAKAAKAAADELVHYRVKLQMSDDHTLAANYYPAKLDTSTPVLLLIHEKGRSSKDFETAVPDLKGETIAEHFQKLGYAVVSFDLRGHGLNKRGSLRKQDWLDMVFDLQGVYDFLLDRHNRGELNVAKLGVLALGEGANLTATWAEMPEGAISSEGRTTDLAALALISPTATWEGTSFDTQIKEIGPRIRVLLAAGERDDPSKTILQKVRDGLLKIRQNQVKLFPTLLHGYKLLQLEPGTMSAIDAFFDDTVKSKAIDWEPRYNMTPTPFTQIEMVKHAKPAEKAKPKDAPAAKDKPADAAKPATDAAKAKDTE